MRITKEHILKGKDFRHTEQILGGEVVMRPLTDGEISSLHAKLITGLSEEYYQSQHLGKPKLSEKDAHQLFLNQMAVQYEAVALSLSVEGESWAPEDVGQLPSGVPDKLYEVVERISTGGSGADAKLFRRKPGRTTDTPSA